MLELTMTSVASSPHTTNFLLCPCIVNGTPWTRKIIIIILDENSLRSNFFFGKRGPLGGGIRHGQPGKTWFPLLPIVSPPLLEVLGEPRGQVQNTPRRRAGVSRGCWSGAHDSFILFRPRTIILI
ncbi:hypothetical protein PspLS_02688 [Pyricularia sp. CBS 133598]|nr:hypothetical protein PspLS_02688 [Pyricularia sp. CBS 133598]